MNHFQQSPDDEFEEAKDQLLFYSFSSQFDGHLSPKNKKKKLASQKEKPQLALVKQNPKEQQQFMSTFYNKRQTNKGQRGRVIKIGDATFKSNFQCGNISMVDHVGPNTYKISMQNQINSGRMSIWFYFSVQGLKGQNTFIIQGFSKPSSLYNQGMKICYRQNSNGQWRRGGNKISYVKSQQNQQQKNSYQLKFNYFFQSNNSTTVEFAYCFPYSFTKLLNFIYGSGNSIMVETLAKSFQGKAIPLLTIGNLNSQNVIFVSARVHPGQTVSSFMMEGFIKQLIGDTVHAKLLRENVLFKIVPMLNPDGVTRGNYRFSVSGCDLNRKWRGCKPQKHPQIYYWRQYMRKISKQKNVLMFMDLHGHSRKKNVFFYGCCPKQNGVYNTKAKQFPYLMQQIYGTAFKYDYCAFAVQKDKQGTARICMWKDLKIDYVYTCQATFCGGVNGSNFLQNDYQKVGNKLCQGIAIFFSEIFLKDKASLQVDQKLQKMLLMKNKIKQDLINNPQLQQIGMNGDSGSQSDPDTGQNTTGVYDSFNRTIIRTSKATKKSISDKYSSNKIKTTVLKKQIFPQLEQYSAKNAKTQKNSDIQFTINFDRPITTAKQYRSQQFPSQENQLHKINKKVRGTHIAFGGFGGFGQKMSHKNLNQLEEQTDQTNQELNNLNTAQAFRRKLMLQKGGAQYRRVRKLAQQSNRQNYTQNHHSLGTQPVVKGLVGVNNMLNLQAQPRKIKNVVSHFYPHSRQGKRGSVQMYYKRHMKASQYGKKVYLNGDEISMKLNVRCLGSRICPRTQLK